MGLQVSHLTPSDLPVIPSNLKTNQLFVPVSTNNIDFLPEPTIEMKDHFDDEVIAHLDQTNFEDGFSDEFLPVNQFDDKITFLPEPVPAVPEVLEVQVQTQKIVFPSEDDEELLDFDSLSENEFSPVLSRTAEGIPIFSLQSVEELSAIAGASLQPVA